MTITPPVLSSNLCGSNLPISVVTNINRSRKGTVTVTVVVGGRPRDEMGKYDETTVTETTVRHELGRRCRYGLLRRGRREGQGGLYWSRSKVMKT